MKRSFGEKLQTLSKILMGKRILCKYIHKKHDYRFYTRYREGKKPYRWNVYVRRCANCGHHKKMVF